MKLTWTIDPDDVNAVKELLKAQAHSAFVKNRISRNMRQDKHPVELAEFWSVLIGCLLTTQQRSGPESLVNRFLSERPFPLPFETCRDQPLVSTFVTSVLAEYGGFRRGTTIGIEAAANLAYLLKGGWEATHPVLEEIRLSPGVDSERRAARFIDDHYRGFGPKQSRNLLQGLGLSQFEIPIDSRIMKWLNRFGFPFQLSASGLSDRAYYELVSDGLIKLAEASGIAPCILDAAIFSSFDGNRWTEDNLVW